MKIKHFLLLLMCTITLSLSAQIKIDSIGNVGIGIDESKAKLHIYSSSSDANQCALKAYNSGGSGKYSWAGYFYNNRDYSSLGLICGIRSYSVVNGGRASFRGIEGYAYSNTAYDEGRAYGVYGYAGNATSGYNYAIYGYLRGSNNGAAIFGNDGTSGDNKMYAKYAGYFQGDVMITSDCDIKGDCEIDGDCEIEGDCFANTFTPSDSTLKTDIKTLDNQKGKLKKLNSYTFKYTEEYFDSTDDNLEITTSNISDTVDIADSTTITTMDLSRNSKIQEFTNRTNYGLLAQEVQKVYPELVTPMKNGKLAINYTGFISILIEAYQEQQVTIDSLCSEMTVFKEKLNIKDESTNSEKASLSQVEPTTYSDNTKIKIVFSLPETSEQAYIFIYDLTGKQLLSFNLTDNEKGFVKFKAKKLYAGKFDYTLVADGEIADSKQMILME